MGFLQKCRPYRAMKRVRAYAILMILKGVCDINDIKGLMR